LRPSSPRPFPGGGRGSSIAVSLGAAFLIWPALVNGYPILFSDTGALLEMALDPNMGWDKPWVYGPFLTPFHLRQTLWGAVAAQGLLVSWMLWLTQAVLMPPRPWRHAALCAVLAVATAAPWFTALLMPDVFTPIVVLGLFILAYGPARLGRGTLACVVVAAAIAIAAHLAHLVLAAGIILVAGVLRRAVPWRPALPLAGALAMLLASNLVGNGVLTVSPYGSVFALARLVGDGPGRDWVDAACPAANRRICAWRGRLTADSDQFLWGPYGPVWFDGFGPIRYAPEAKLLVPAIIAAYPGAVLLAAAENTLRQLGRVQVGDALTALHVDVAVLPRLELYFPPAEAAQYRGSLQAADQLDAVAAPFRPLHLLALLAGAAATVGIALRRRGPLQGLAVLVLAGLLANAAATGALSGPHDRYQARIAWLVVLPPLLGYAAARDASRRTTSSGAIRTSAS